LGIRRSNWVCGDTTLLTEISACQGYNAENRGEIGDIPKRKALTPAVGDRRTTTRRLINIMYWIVQMRIFPRGTRDFGKREAKKL